MKKKPNLKLRLAFLHIGSFIVTIAPVLIFVICNWGSYVKTGADTVKISLGLVIAIILVLLKVIGKLKMPSRVVTYSVICIMSYFLYPLIQDIVWLSALCLAGEVLDLLIFQKPIKSTKERITIEKTSDATTEKVSAEVRKMFEEYNSGGRA